MLNGKTLKNSIEHIYKLLTEVPDPEIPVLSVLDLGVIRNVEHENDLVTVTITPTYSGCPAMNTFEEDIISHLKKNGYENVTVETVLSPAWTTDWISQEARQKLEDYGIAPPIDGTADKGQLFYDGPKNVRCPQCKSTNTELINMTGSTACKALYKCKDCLEPFDYFKCI